MLIKTMCVFAAACCCIHSACTVTCQCRGLLHAALCYDQLLLHSKCGSSSAEFDLTIAFASDKYGDRRMIFVLSLSSSHRNLASLGSFYEVDFCLRTEIKGHRMCLRPQR